MPFPLRPALLAVLLALSACADDGLLARTTSSGRTTRNARFADAALSGGLPQAALDATRVILEQDPGNVQALLQQGDALSVLGRGDAAAEAYRRASAAGTGSADQVRRASLGLGRAKLLAGQGPEAEQQFRGLVAEAPGFAAGHNGLGIALDLQGRHAEAQSAYRASLACSEAEGPRVNLGLSLALSGDVPGALAVLGPLAAEPAPTPRIRHNLALALAMAGDRAAASRILTADLPKDQVVTALSGYEALRTTTR